MQSGMRHHGHDIDIISGTSFIIGYLVASAVTLGNFPSRYKGLVVSIMCCSWWLGQSFFNYLYTVTKPGGSPIVGNIFLILGICIFVVKGLGAFLIYSIPLDEDDAESPTPVGEKDYSLMKTEKTYNSMDQDGCDTDKQTATNRNLTQSCRENPHLQVFLDPDFHLLAWGFVIGAGTEIMYMDSVSIIAASLLLGDLYEITLFVAPIASMIGTFICGWLSDITRNVFPRSLYPTVGRLCNAIMLAIGAVYGTNSAVFVLTTIIMYCTNGMSFSIIVTVVGERFGMPHFKRNLGFVLMASSVTTLVITATFGAFYDGAIVKKNVHFCRGIICVQNIFVVGSVLSVVSSACFILLERRYIMHCLRSINGN